MSPVIHFIAGIALLYFCQKVVEFRNALRSINYLPGYRHLFSQHSLVAHVLPPIPYANPGANHTFDLKHEPFARFGWDITSIVHAFPRTKTALVVADADIAREVLFSRARFPKAVELFDVVRIYGQNIIASEGEEWKKFRKVSAPAFTDSNNKLVWAETMLALTSILDDLWKDKEVISIDDFKDIAIPFTLSVLAVAGFGRGSRRDNELIPADHKMSFQESLTLMCTDIHLKLSLPDRVLDLTERTRKVKLAYHELAVYIGEMIEERRTLGPVEKGARHDLLSNFIEAASSSSADKASHLTEAELIGNIFIFLLAGHETSAHTLCFALGLLALYPDEQERLYRHIHTIVSEGQEPRYEDMSKVTYALAVIYETVRMFPPGVNVLKVSAEDTSFLLRKPCGESLVVPVPKDTMIYVNAVALHYNPRYWKDPHTFNPSRFEGDWPKDAFIPFSAGSRTCIGRRFFETSTIATLVKMISHYQISIKEEPQFSSETFEQRKVRILRADNLLTLTPSRMPLTFKRRSEGRSC